MRSSASLTGAGVRGLAKEQAALRRVATLVARGVPAGELFSAVTEEVRRVLSAEYAHLIRYGPDDAATVLAAFGRTEGALPLGTRLKLGGRNATTLVFETGRSARIDGYVGASGPLGDTAREHGVRSSVGAPIMVEARLWGVMVVGCSEEQPLPADTEARLADFTELVAIAVANADSRAGLALLAEEQAALRRVATLVARGTPPEEVFAAVVEEVGRLFSGVSVDYAGMARYEPDGAVTVLASVGSTDFVPVGTRLTPGELKLGTIVFETGRPARVDDYADASGPFGIALHEMGVRSAIAAPIIIEDRLWGVVAAGSTLGQPLPVRTEARLASFTELVATAVANAESRASLAQLAEEQEALRRVATLVARGVPPEEVFASVTEEVERLFLSDVSNLVRFESDGMFTILASARGRFPVGSRWPVGGKNVTTLVFETGRPGRIDNFVYTGPLADDIRGEIRSAIGAPIIVEGHLWGALNLGRTTREPPLPPDTEARLADFTELVATAIANADSRAELTASRARIVAAADETRRRIERDLHDGAQQRLVHTVIVQQLALRALQNGDSNVGELMAEALQHAEQANSELSELAHGILPSVLTREGLGAGVGALVSRMSLPVSVDVAVERLPAGVEATAYFVVSEALTNVVKHARADAAAVRARVDRGVLRIEIRDEGVGGAHVRDSTGLHGLEDRVSALEGQLTVESPPGQGTRVCALLPVTDPG
jgi:GAF domain-containing protein